jgi:UDP-N-acetylmuramyl pentapeptide phosphotransferase/UDP-N-acetylglucosamine-1-phosphate transferase
MQIVYFSIGLSAIFIFSLAIVYWLKQNFSKTLLDIPNDRSTHTQPTPRGGGLGFIIAFGLAYAIAAVTRTFGNTVEIIPSWTLWYTLIPLAILGFLDDRYNLSARTRYMVQLGSSGIAVACFGIFPQPWFTDLGIGGLAIAAVLTVIGMTALINFYNFMDGLDGLVAGITVVQLTFLGWYSHQPMLYFLASAIMGFLYWNWSPAKIFMGDVGSTGLGAIIAIALLNHHSDVSTAWSAVAITLPISADATYTICRRLRLGENIFKAHRSHIYQRLQIRGWSHAQVAYVYIGLTVGIAVSLSLWNSLGAILALVVSAIAIIGSELYLSRTHKISTE